jgi:MOSC domain-containing protein YiiM
LAEVIAVCSSKEKGTRKLNIGKGTLREAFGLLGDAHADRGSHRQVSLLAIESINGMREQGYDVAPGDFAENLTTRGLELASLPVGTQIRIGARVLLEVTQIGKACHDGCAIFREVGKCIMPRNGVFARVVHGGTVACGDFVEVAKG